MHVAQLWLTDFRGYTESEVRLGPGVSAFIGPNGHGKTNLVEAVGYLASQGSHRVAQDTPLVRAGADRAVVRGDIVHEGRHAFIELEINPGKSNRARLNRSPVSRPREVLGMLRAVLFAPEDLALVKGDPDTRRRFLDELLVARAPRLASVRQDYDRVLRQRNTLLKTAGGRRGEAATASAKATLDVWDSHLARAGAELLAARIRTVEALRPLVTKAYAEVAPEGGEAWISYRGSVSTEEEPEVDHQQGAEEATSPAGSLETAMAGELARRRGEELERGVSLVGPHRDDLGLELGGMPAKGYASQGESWSFALALKLASYELLRRDGAEPVLLLDDVFAELDVERRTRLARFASTVEQALVTAAVPDDVPQELVGEWYNVVEQQVSPSAEEA